MNINRERRAEGQIPNNLAPSPRFLIESISIRNALNFFPHNKKSISNRDKTPTLLKKWRSIAIALACVLLAAIALPARFRQPSSEYQTRRAKLRAAIDGPFVLYGFTGKEDASEVALFFQEPYFYYLTGHDEPGAVVIVIPDVPGKKVDGP